MKIGDYVIVHVGFALSIVDQAAAEQTLTNLAEMKQIENDLNFEKPIL